METELVPNYFLFNKNWQSHREEVAEKIVNCQINGNNK